MPVSLTVYPDRGLVYSVFRGEVTEEEFLARAEALRSHPEFDSSFSEILDLRAVTELRTSAQALKYLSSRDGLFDYTSRHVVIAPPGLYVRMARLFQSSVEEGGSMFWVVRTPEEAFDCCAGYSSAITFSAISHRSDH